MSLFKQLLIFISALFLVIFSVNFALSVSNTKAYLEGESINHAQDTATSLGLSLSPYMVNSHDPLLKTMISAIFDMGYYKQIRLVDIDKKELVALNNDTPPQGVPKWFIDFLPMISATAESEISSDWALTGTIYVTINPNYGYLSLYQQAKMAFYYSLAAFVFAILLLALLLRVTLASLKRINQLALQIADSNFTCIEELPWTSEVRNVATSMNIMSRKIKTVVNNLNDKLESMGASLQRDELTGLYKKAVFETDMKHLFMEEGRAFLLLIKIDSLASLVNEQDSHVIDQFLKEFADLLQLPAQQQPDRLCRVYRFYGAEFVILLKTDNIQQLEALVKTLAAGFLELGKKYQKPDLAHIGAVPINPVSTTEANLEAAYEAYEQAQLIGANSYFIGSGENFARDISDWKELVFNCIDNAAYTVSYIGGIASLQSGELLMVEAFTKAYDLQGEPVAIGPFIAIAEKFAKIIDFDKGVIGKVLEHLRSSAPSHAIAVNLSTRTINNADFRLWLEQLIKQNKALAKQMVFSLAAYAVAKDIEGYRNFIAAVHQWGGRVMIKRFETQSISPDMIKQLKPDFIRLAREMGNGIDSTRQKQEFVQALQDIGSLLDIVILAENVQADCDYQRLKTIGIVGASR